MILAVGLSPAWQQIMRFDAFHAGEVNRADEVHWCASGKAVNVALALARLGGEVELLSSAGGATGQALRREVEAAGVRSHWVASAAATRVCTTIVESGKGLVTELVENTAAMSDAERDAVRLAYSKLAARARLVIFSGTLPAGSPADFYRTLLNETPCPALLDFRGAELWHALECRPLLVKPNREELARTVGRPVRSDVELRAAVRELHEHGAQWVVITGGSRPVFVSGPDRQFLLRPPRVEVVNPIASGDCLMAGLAWGMSLGMSMAESLRLGVAAAALNVSQLLPARLDAAEVERLARSVAVEDV